jgi:hypothetical protein
VHERELVLIFSIFQHCSIYQWQHLVEDLVELEDDRERHEVLDCFFMGANLHHREYVDSLHENADHELEDHAEDSKPWVLEVFRVHRDVFERHRRGSHIVYRETVEDKHTDETSDLDRPIICWFENLVDVFARIGVHDEGGEENRKDRACDCEDINSQFSFALNQQEVVFLFHRGHILLAILGGRLVKLILLVRVE